MKPRNEGLQTIITSSGISLRLWRLYAYFWLVFLFFPIYYLAISPLALPSILFASCGLVVFVTIYLWVMWPYPLIESGNNRSELISPWLLLTGLTLLVLALILVYGSAYAWLFLGISAIAGVRLPAKRAFWAVMGLTLLTLAGSILASGGIFGADWLQVIPLVLLVRGLGLDMTGMKRLGEALQELNLARHELARQAIVEERLRMARDLHDLLGHSLSLIALKSELAGSLIAENSAQAAREIRDVETVARQALREVRQAVSGYRQISLAGELNGARQILEAAGISCRIDFDSETLPADIDAALAWTVREAVTNVIRHSSATQCLIHLTRQDDIVHAEVINDGYHQSHQEPIKNGSGLSGLAERLASQEGSLEAGPFLIENKAGFRLKVEIPVHSNTASMEVLQK